MRNNRVFVSIRVIETVNDPRLVEEMAGVIGHTDKELIMDFEYKDGMKDKALVGWDEDMDRYGIIRII